MMLLPQPKTTLANIEASQIIYNMRSVKEYETPCPIRFYAVVSSIYLLI